MCASLEHHIPKMKDMVEAYTDFCTTFCKELGEKTVKRAELITAEVFLTLVTGDIHRRSEHGSMMRSRIWQRITRAMRSSTHALGSR